MLTSSLTGASSKLNSECLSSEKRDEMSAVGGHMLHQHVQSFTTCVMNVNLRGLHNLFVLVHRPNSGKKSCEVHNTSCPLGIYLFFCNIQINSSGFSVYKLVM